jgi:hypothetical protein
VPEHLRALIVILVLAALAFALARRTACAVAMSPADFARRRNLWFGVTLTAFLAHNFWVYIVVCGVLLWLAARRESNAPALYFFLLFAVPTVGVNIGGLGLLEQLFNIDYLRLLSLTVLLPAYFALRRNPEVVPFGRLLPDKLLLAYLALQFLLMLETTTFTNALRVGFFYPFLDVWLPYYVASRALRSHEAVREALMAFVVAALVLSAIGVFEMLKGWLLYKSLEDALGASWAYSTYLRRGDGPLRALASTGQPIALGFVLAVALGCFLYLARLVPDRKLRIVAGLVLLGGLVAPLSRGPWVGALLILVVFLGTGPSVQRLSVLVLGGLALFAGLLASGTGGGIAQYLPFGNTDSFNVTYRERLLEIALQEIMRSPWFGGLEVIYSPAFRELVQGESFVDFVNTYVGIALSSGFVGLGLFCGFFAAVGLSLWRTVSRSDRKSESRALGRALLATLAGILAIIFTVASITVIPAVYWSLAGIAVAYSLLAQQTAGSRAKQAVAGRVASGAVLT